MLKLSEIIKIFIVVYLKNCTCVPMSMHVCKVDSLLMKNIGTQCSVNVTNVVVLMGSCTPIHPMFVNVLHVTLFADQLPVTITCSIY